MLYQKGRIDNTVKSRSPKSISSDILFIFLLRVRNFGMTSFHCFTTAGKNSLSGEVSSSQGDSSFHSDEQPELSLENDYPNKTGHNL